MKGDASVNASETAYQTILAMIVSGGAPGGTWLREQELAERSGVSRTPVRQALNRLAAEGVVDISPNRGAQVSELRTKDAEDLLLLRAQLEPLAVRLTVPHLQQTDIDVLADLARRMSELSARGEAPAIELQALNARFHGLLTEGCGNKFLVAAIKAAVMPATIARTYAAYGPDSLRRSMQHHAEILDAVRAGNAGWAESAMRTHILAAQHAYVDESAREQAAMNRQVTK